MIKKLFNNSFLLLILIFVISLFIRLYDLGNTPHGLHNDEVANTYGARYILMNGHDMYGNRWPLLYLDKFGDYPPILPMYLSGLGTFIFGNNEFGSRSLIAITGSFIIFPAYYLSLYIFKRKKTALFTALVFAFGPWHVVLSRLNAEGIMALTVYMIGLAILFRSIQQSRMKLFIFSAICFLSTYLMYPSFRIIVPLTLLPGFFLVKHYKLQKKWLYVWSFFIILSFGLTISISSTHWGKGRFEQTSFVSPMSGVPNKLQQLIFNEDKIVIARIFDNKIIGYGKILLYQYSRYFTYYYLFDEGGIPKIYSVPFMGLLYLTLLPLILISALGFFQKENQKIDNKIFVYLFYILLISPIPAALTVLDVPSIHRAILTPALLIFIAAYGFNGLLSFKLKKVPLIILILIIFAGESIFFIHNYFQQFSYYTTIYRNAGNKEAMQFAFNNRNKYDAIYITNEEAWLPTYYLFYSNDYNSTYTGKFKANFRLPQIDKVHFPEEECPAINIMNKSITDGKLIVSKKTLFIQTINCQLYASAIGRSMFYHIETIKRLDETEVYYIDAIRQNFDEADLLKLNKL